MAQEGVLLVPCNPIAPFYRALWKHAGVSGTLDIPKVPHVFLLSAKPWGLLTYHKDTSCIQWKLVISSTRVQDAQPGSWIPAAAEQSRFIYHHHG